MSKRKKKLKLPKRIAGVKIPKAVRKGPVADFLNSSGGQVLLAEALVLAGGIFGVRRLETATGGQSARETIEETSARLSYACSEALRAFRAALSEPVPAGTEAPLETDSSQSEESPGVEEASPTVKKKRRASRTETAATRH